MVMMSSHGGKSWSQMTINHTQGMVASCSWWQVSLLRDISGSTKGNNKMSPDAAAWREEGERESMAGFFSKIFEEANLNNFPHKRMLWIFVCRPTIHEGRGRM